MPFQELGYFKTSAIKASGFMNSKVEAYIKEEVSRQGHDVNDPLDGGLRVQWMKTAWNWAYERSLHQKRPGLCDIIEVGRRVEPHFNACGIRKCRVRVGPRLCPDPEDLPRLLDNLIENGVVLQPLEWYKEFELIHPFRDGNGRAGKILYSWIGQCMDDPKFPPNDLFGDPIMNP